MKKKEKKAITRGTLILGGPLSAPCTKKKLTPTYLQVLFQRLDTSLGSIQREGGGFRSGGSVTGGGRGARAPSGEKSGGEEEMRRRGVGAAAMVVDRRAE